MGRSTVYEDLSIFGRSFPLVHSDVKRTKAQIRVISRSKWRYLEMTLSASVSLLNPLNAELNPICYLLALLGAHHFLRVSRIRVKSLTLRLLMSYIYIYIYDINSLRVNTSAHCSGRKQVKG